MMSTLTIQNLRKSYKKNIVVKNVSLKIASGQIVGLLGPNGAGKTTTFYMIVGLIAADHGNILLDQKNLTKTPIHIRAKQGISYLPQEPSIFRKMDVSENIISILELRNLSKQQIKLELESLLKELNIQHIKKNTAISLSGGERRRVEIARCLANKPKFILLDEPFAGIDPIAVIDIQKIIKQLSSNGIGILITDHSVRETLGICDQAYIVNQGEIFAQGTPKVIAQNQSVKDIYLGENFIL
jgi:lipopolysaccharide export system ATP-binding protein